jgi:Domain of unknown function (DUF3883)
VLISPPLARNRGGVSTDQFKKPTKGDFAERDAKNRRLGLAGELAVLALEKKQLTERGKADLAEKVVHTAVIEGDGAGYDIQSYFSDGRTKFIEVKTTAGASTSDFFISANEVEFSIRHPDEYLLYRVYEFEESTARGKAYILSAPLTDVCALTAIAYRARLLPTPVMQLADVNPTHCSVNFAPCLGTSGAQPSPRTDRPKPFSTS